MSKKEYLIEILTKLQNSWPLASGLLIVISQTENNETIIDGVYSSIVEAIKTTTNNSAKEKLQQAQSILEKIKEQESKERAEEEENNNIEQLIADL